MATTAEEATGQHHYHRTMMSSLRKRRSLSKGQATMATTATATAAATPTRSSSRMDARTHAQKLEHTQTHTHMHTHTLTHTDTHLLGPLVTCGIFCTLNSLAEQAMQKILKLW